MLAKNSDEEVVSRALTEKAAFAEIVSRYESKLLRYIRRIGVYQEQDAEDVLQNVFLKVYRHLNDFDPSLSFSSWIYRIAHNETVSFLRKKNVRPQGHYVYDSEDALKRICDEYDTANEAESNINQEHIRASLSKIKQKYRDVIILRYFEEREYKEISDILKIPTSSVGTLLHRAKKSLQKTLKHIR